MTQEKETSEQTGANFHGGVLLAKVLKDQGVKYIFGVHGGHLWPLERGLYEYGIERIHMRHEQAAAYAADAYARCTRTPGVCYGTAGPGMTNMVSGIAQAWEMRSPVVGIFGQHLREQNHRAALQESYAEEVFKSMSKWCMVIDDYRTIPLYLRRALRECLLPPPAPVCLAFTPMALYTTVNKSLVLGDVPASRKAYPLPAAGDPQGIERAVKMVIEAKKPVVVAGDGVHWAEASDELKEFVELLQVPVQTRRLARGAVPEDHPMAITGGFRGRFWRDADLVVHIGLQLGSLESFGLPPVWPARARRIIIHESATEAWSALPCELEITGNARLVLRQMIDCARDLLKGKELDRKGWLEWLDTCREEFKAWLAELRAEFENWKPIHAHKLGKEIVEFLDPSATIIYDSFTGTAFLTDQICARFSGQVLDAGQWAGVGHGIGMAIGAQLARPGKQTLVMMGDGGMGVGGMDIETALRYKLPVVYVIHNNSTWLGGSNMFLKDQVYSWDMLPDLRYDKMFEAIGCHGEFVTEPAELRGALERAFNSGKTAVVNVIVDRRVYNPYLDTQYGRTVILGAADLKKVPEDYRDLLQKGATPDVAEEMKKKGLPWPRVSRAAAKAERESVGYVTKREAG